MQLNEHAIVAVILAGGQGRRIGGEKAQVLLGGKPLWRHVADRVAPQVSGLAVNAATPMEDQEVIADAVADLGPLGGILAAMNWAEAKGASRVLTVAVDTPFLPLDLVTRLRDVSGPVAMAETSDGLHGTTALWDVSLAPDLEAWLEGGGRKVTQWAMSHEVTRVHFADTIPPGFFNVNTPQDLTRAEAWL